MSKEWILNAATGRWQLNFKRNVGAVAEEIRACAPGALEAWRNYYLENVRSQEHLDELGKRLFGKISNVMRAEMDAISEADCVAYLSHLVIERTFEGYQTEKSTVYELLETILNVEIRPAPDEWDRLFNVDFYIPLRTGTIGLQIKPVTFYNASEWYKWRDVQAETHAKWKARFGGEVFIVASVKKGDKKAIANAEILPQIEAEIQRLGKEIQWSLPI